MTHQQSDSARREIDLRLQEVNPSGMACQFAERLLILLEAVLGGWKPSCGVQAARVVNAEKRLGVRLPSILSVFYIVAGRHSRLMTSYNRFSSPEELELHNGKILFCWENQGIVFWGTTASVRPKSDPEVFQGNPEDEEWFFDCHNLSTFLCCMLCWQAVQGVLRHRGYTQIGDHDSEVLETLMAPVNCGRGSQEYDLRAYCRGSLIACIIGDSPEYELFLGARRKQDIARIENQLGIEVE